jgi:hypothetical protein
METRWAHSGKIKNSNPIEMMRINLISKFAFPCGIAKPKG